MSSVLGQDDYRYNIKEYSYIYIFVLYYEVIFKYCAVSNHHHLPWIFPLLWRSACLYVCIVGIRSTSYIWCEHNRADSIFVWWNSFIRFSQRYFRAISLCQSAFVYNVAYIYIAYIDLCEWKTRKANTHTHILTYKIKISRKRFETFSYLFFHNSQPQRQAPTRLSLQMVVHSGHCTHI